MAPIVSTVDTVSIEQISLPGGVTIFELRGTIFKLLIIPIVNHSLYHFVPISQTKQMPFHSN